MRGRRVLFMGSRCRHVTGIGNVPEVLGLVRQTGARIVWEASCGSGRLSKGVRGPSQEEVMSIESPLIGSGSQEEVDARVNALIDLGKSRGFLTYEELNEKLPDEVVSPDKLDSLLMMIDEMGIKLIDEMDIGDFI